VRGQIEVQAKTRDNEPFSWWLANVRSFRGSVFFFFPPSLSCLSLFHLIYFLFLFHLKMYSIRYANIDEEHTEVMEKHMMRPQNKKYFLSLAFVFSPC
jgi:hypothetical protein